MREIFIRNKAIGDNHPTCIVFECGPTHNGLSSAKKLVDLASESGASCVKFQMLNADKLVSDKTQLFKYSILLDKKNNNSLEVEEPLYQILKRRELSKDEWRELAEYIIKKHMIFICTVIYVYLYLCNV